MGIRSRLMELTKQSGAERPLYRYGMLLVIFVLCAWQIKLYLAIPIGYTGDPYGGFVGILMLLFFHLASAFKWHKRLAVILWVLFWSWLVFGFFYILYLSRVLYPLPPLP